MSENMKPDEFKQRAIQYYARTAASYDTWHAAGAESREVAYIAQRAEGKTLDLCTGTGRVLIALLRREVDAYGIDFSPDLLKMARRKGIPAERLALMDAENLGFEKDAFDTAVIYGSLHRSANPYRIIDEMMRVAKHKILIRDDCFFWTRWWKAKVPSFIAQNVRKLYVEPLAVDDCVSHEGPTMAFEVATVRQMLKQAGFKVQVKGLGIGLPSKLQFLSPITPFIRRLPVEAQTYFLIEADRK